MPPINDEPDEADPDGTQRYVGTWDDQVEVVERDGRPVLRRIQHARVGERTSSHEKIHQS